MLRPIVLLSLAFSASSGQTPVPQSPSGTPRPVNGAAKAFVTKEISFTEFEFQQTSLLHAGPGLFRLAGEPSQMLATDRPMTYKVAVGGAFEGRIDNLAGEGTLYQSFVADGTQPCPPPRY